MMFHSLRAKTLLLLGLLFALSQANGNSVNEWIVDSDASQLHFVHVKNNQVGEVSRFETLKGHLSSNGQYALEILLDSVNTGIEIRDQRMREHLFNSSKNVAFIVNGRFDLERIKGQQVGETSQHTLDATLQLGNDTLAISAPVTIQTLAGNRLRVTSHSPLLISTGKLQLDAGVDKLQSLAGLRSIDRVVPVTFDIYLSPKQD